MAGLTQSLRGQSQALGGRRSYASLGMQIDTLPISSQGNGSVTAQRPCYALIYAWGGGGGGVNTGTLSASTGGGGGGFLFRKCALSTGQTLSWTVGSGNGNGLNTDGGDGGDTIVSLPSGVMLVAGGGKGGKVSGIPGAGGIAFGGLINRNGGDGGATQTSGASAGLGGGLGGSSSAGKGGGGGGAGGFGNVVNGTTGGIGGAGGQTAGDSVTATGLSPGGGGAGIATITSGGGGMTGKVVIVLLRIPG